MASVRPFSFAKLSLILGLAILVVVTSFFGKAVKATAVQLSGRLLLAPTSSSTFSGAWIQLNPTGTPPTPRGFHGMTTVYDPGSNRMIVFGGRMSDVSNTNDVWVLTNANGLGGTSQWINLIPNNAAGAPPVRSGHTAVYDSATNRMIIFAGCNSGCSPVLNDVWVLTNANGLGGTPAWIHLNPSGGQPTPRTRPTAVYDSANNRMIVFAGQNGGGFGCSTFSDVWVLTNANGLGGTSTWTQLAPTGGPPSGQYGASGVYDPASNRMTVFGGGGFVTSNCQNSNAVWVLSNANGLGGVPTWINLVAEGVAGSPPSRSFHSAVYDLVTNQMIIFGGNDLACFNDVWRLSNANGLGGTSAWNQLTPACGPPEARSSQGAILDLSTERMTIFGGNNNAGNYTNDTWILTNATGNGPSVLVTNTNDSGTGSLRSAISFANANPGTTIVFNIPTGDPGFSNGVFTIKPTSELPTLNGVMIDGTTQTTFTGDTNLLGPEIVLNGSLQSSGNGLRLDDSNVVIGLAINGFPANGIVLSYAFASGGVSNGNQICGNYIGTDAAGTSAVPNGEDGIKLNGFGSPSQQASNNVIQGNLISANHFDGITLCDAGQTQIINNLIGTTRSGLGNLGNGGNGITFGCAGAPSNLVANNTIAFNHDDAIYDSPDYRFSVAFTSSGHQGNAFRRNSIFANGGLGINIFPPPLGSEPPHTPTPNDNCDGDTGGNLLQNYPIITQVTNSGNTTSIFGTLNSAPNQTFDVELFSSDAANPSGYGEGQTYLGGATVTTDANCTVSFSLVFIPGVPAGKFITATATDSAGNTSEFSPAFPTACPTVTGISPVSGPESSMVTITGANLIGVTAVTFSNNLSAAFTINSATQITATVPVGAVTGAITITRPGCGDVLTGTFTVGPCINVSISNALTVPIGGSVVIPVMVSDLSGRGILSYDFTLLFNPAVLQLQNPPIDAAGTLSSGMSITPNTSMPGKLTIAAFSTTALSGSGTLLKLRFNVIGAIAACSDLTWQSFQFNEGVPCVTLSNGRACVVGASISGTVSYCVAPAKKVPGVIVRTNNTPPITSTTNNTGLYSLTGLNGGAVTVTPQKSGDVNGVSSFDASLVAQRVAGLITFSGCQASAGDVSDNGSLSSFDAALIAQFAVGINSPGNIAGTWKFAPPNRAYASVAGDLTGQDYDAVLMGDVSGNWQAPGILRSAPLAQVPVSLPNSSGMTGAGVTVPVTVGNLTGQGITSFDFDLVFDQNVLQLQNPPVDAAGTLSSGLVITPNPESGRLRVSGFGTTPLTGTGTLLKLKFNVVGAPGTTTALTWQSFLFNEDVQNLLTNGSLNVPSACGAITVSPASQPNGTLGAAYNQMFTASGGAGPYSFSLSAGELPGNVTLSSGGALAGTPNAAGIFNFTVTATDTNGCTGPRTYNLTIDPAGSGLQFYPLPSPVRLLDTRLSATVGCVKNTGPFANSETRSLPAQTVCSTIPANATAVIGNITVVPSGPGFLTLFPSDAAQPTVANSNFKAGEVTNNFFTVGLGATGVDTGAFKIFTSLFIGGTNAEVIIDVTGYYAPPSAGGLYYHVLPAPVRLLQTFPGQTGCILNNSQQLQGTNDANANPALDLVVQGRSPGLPSPCSGIPNDAVVLVGNATTVFPVAPFGFGYLTIYPSDATRPTVASSNYGNNDIINGPFAVKLGADGNFKIYTFSTTHLVIDISGYYSANATDANGAGLLFNPLPKPMRLLETRSIPGFTLTGCYQPQAPIQGGTAGIRTQQAWGSCADQSPLAIPTAARALAGNVTVINPLGAGFGTFFPGDVGTAPTVATTNYPFPVVFGYNRHYYVGLSPADGTFKIMTQFTSDYIVDVSGYFAP